ncbi:response regulator transcription factor [Bacillus sp. FSL K6-6540]|uniref:response regulator transcription factor n=1 Tax=Bacillus sp. FSL K6-6540 TaxID=2921512 RepID=UPI0030F86AC0
MVNIAVVDDEERIRLGLGKLIRDAGEQYRVVGTFASGQELLDQWHELQPDLVITDIKMPQMNGLQLMANIKQMASRTKFAVLSGYNDFEYARTAMRQGALEYLLKPVNMKELLRMLENVDELVKGEQNERKLESDDLVSFLLGTDQRTMPEHLFEEVCDRLDQQALFHGHYAVLLLRTFPEIAEEKLLAWTSVWGTERRIIGCEGGRQAILASIAESGYADMAREWAAMLLQQLPAGTSAKLGISGVFSGSRWLPQAYREAASVLEQAWYSDERRNCGGEGIAAVHREERYRLVRSLDKQLLPALRAGEYARLPAAMGTWLEETASLRPGWAELREASLTLESHVAEEMKQRGIDAGDADWNLEPGDSENWRSFAGRLKRAVEAAAGLLDQGKSEHRAVETIKAYIQQHYTEELELQHLADLVYLTPSYLSKLFKTETGETITDYCIAVRIEHAKRLLKEDHGLKTYMVGERVGYPDPAYFNKVFKKMTGKTPKEYRDFVR